QLVMTDAYFFSLGFGDSSHMTHVVRQLQSQKIRVHIRIMDSTRSVKQDIKDYSINLREAHK
ncbi:MAG: hypothetical protein Q7T80_17535, partial [Methanoregula sp.]|nr:hypothetical protein [Methanoregula sp.]